MAVSAGCKFGQKLCEALGIDPGQHSIRRLVIDVPADGAIVVFFERFLDQAEVAKLIASFRAEHGIELHEVRGLEVDQRGRPRFLEVV